MRHRKRNNYMSVWSMREAAQRRAKPGGVAHVKQNGQARKNTHDVKGAVILHVIVPNTSSQPKMQLRETKPV
jgi:hypothetical protein